MSSKWDRRFMDLAKEVSTWSKDPDHQVGAVVVDRLNRFKSLGYNGPPIKVVDTQLTKEIKQLRTIHAELNAVLNTDACLFNCKMYIYPFSPCAQCAAAIIQKGIKRVVYKTDTNLKTWKASQNEAFQMFKEAGIFIEKL